MKNLEKSVIEKRLNEYREWISDPGSDNLKMDELNYLEEDLKDDSIQSMLNIADSLRFLCTWYSHHGLIKIDKNQFDEGWQNIHLGLLYNIWSFKINISSYLKTKFLGKFQNVQNLSNYLNGIILSYCYIDLNDIHDHKKWFENKIFKLLQDNKAIPIDFWKYRTLEPFILQITAIMENLPFDLYKDNRMQFGIYQEVLKNWDDMADFEKSIYSACEYHIARIEDNDPKTPTEFREAPFDLIPLEILYLFNIRSRHGLENPKIDHPLITSKFSNIFKLKKEIEDDLIDRVKEKYHNFFED